MAASAGSPVDETRETVRQFGQAVSVPRLDVEDAVPTAPAISARHAAWKRWPHARVGSPLARSGGHMVHCPSAAAVGAAPPSSIACERRGSVPRPAGRVVASNAIYAALLFALSLAVSGEKNPNVRRARRGFSRCE